MLINLKGKGFIQSKEKPEYYGIEFKMRTPSWYIYLSNLNQLHRCRIDRKFILIILEF